MQTSLDIQEEAARVAIERSQRIAVISHVRPDGDAVGSLLAMGLALEFSGKQVQMILEDGVPDNLAFLSGSEKVVRSIQSPVDIIIVVDCSEKNRIGSVLAPDQVPDINIDHHITNQGFAAVNLIFPEAAATADILFELLPGLKLAYTPEVVDALLTGILTDTIGFRTVSVSPNTLRNAASLMELGADLPNLYRKALASQTYPALLYWGYGLCNLELEDKIAWTALTLESRRKAGYEGRDDADLINVMSAMRDADIAVMFIEQNDESVKISWRARNGYDVSQLAEYFGGGGHRAASGAEIKGSLEAVKQSVLRKTRELILENKANIEDNNEDR